MKKLLSTMMIPVFVLGLSGCNSHYRDYDINGNQVITYGNFFQPRRTIEEIKPSGNKICYYGDYAFIIRKDGKSTRYDYCDSNVIAKELGIKKNILLNKIDSIEKAKDSIEKAKDLEVVKEWKHYQKY